MRRVYTKEEIEHLITDDADFFHECMMEDRECENEKVVFRKDGGAVVTARKGKKRTY